MLLHGGPGAPHDYLESLEAVAGTGRRAIFYDQLGCGNSSRSDESLWNVETFVEEVGVVREALGLERTHLFGSSWGGMLAMEYALTRPSGLASLVLSSSPASIPIWAGRPAGCGRSCRRTSSGSSTNRRPPEPPTRPSTSRR